MVRPGNAPRYSDDFSVISARTKTPPDARINGAWAAFAIICDVLRHNVSSKQGTILRGNFRPSRITIQTQKRVYTAIFKRFVDRPFLRFQSRH
ncbi:hypothetical protein KCP71_08430 [Salmonella enterica subsp. enterica]|nr:hypothetical protein KCP71_08430 [Salmonella enterica subsp. enterica]